MSAASGFTATIDRTLHALRSGSAMRREHDYTPAAVRASAGGELRAPDQFSAEFCRPSSLAISSSKDSKDSICA